MCFSLPEKEENNDGKEEEEGRSLTVLMPCYNVKPGTPCIPTTGPVNAKTRGEATDLQ